MLNILSIEIDKKLKDHLESLKDGLSKALEKQTEANQKYTEAIKDGDLRENSAYEEAVALLQGVKQEIASYNNEISKVEYALSDLSSYIRTPYISEYSTVHITLVEGDNEGLGIPADFKFKIFPSGISMVKDGIVSSESAIGAQLIDKRVNDTIKIKRPLLSKSATYKIVGFY